MNQPTAVFTWRRTPPPLLIGGAEVSQQLLAEEFTRAGWRVLYVGSHEAPWDGSPQLEHLQAHLRAHGVRWDRAGGEIRYQWNGVQCTAVPQSEVEAATIRALAASDAAVVVTSQEGAGDLAAAARGRASCVAGWLHSVSATSMGVLRGAPHFALATSKFVASRLQAPPETEPVVFYPPFTPPAPGRTPLADDYGPPRHSDEDSVLMVNPIPAKGAHLLHQLIQRLPRRPFTLVEGWWDTHRDFARHPNVRYVPRTYDMASLYASHRVLLVPSQVEDAFPRVITEAALHGVPTIGSDRGGIPEAVAAGGLILDADDTAAWVEAIETISPDLLGAKARVRAQSLTRPCLPELAAAGVIPAPTRAE